ncbi:MAG: hypothetical protein ACI4PH_11535 [Faecousia sp.]
MDTWKEMILGQPVQVLAEPLDDGWDIGIFGGCRTHVGAVTLAESDGSEQTMERFGHKDSHISRRWAVRLSQALGVPVCVRCGIHYDNATAEQIRTIVDACDRMLETVGQKLSGEA